MHTPSQAKDKYCTRDVSRTCIGPDCMGWRWVNKAVYKDGYWKVPKTGQGYCGLAGDVN